MHIREIQIQSNELISFDCRLGGIWLEFRDEGDVACFAKERHFLKMSLEGTVKEFLELTLPQTIFTCHAQKGRCHPKLMLSGSLSVRFSSFCFCLWVLRVSWSPASGLSCHYAIPWVRLQWLLVRPSVLSCQGPRALASCTPLALPAIHPGLALPPCV